jgi:hypothetical protein
MNGLHDLLAKIRKIDEAPAVNLSDPSRDASGNLPAPATASVTPAASADQEAQFAAWTKKQEDLKAQTALAAKLKGMLLKRDDPNTKSKGYFIDPTNGLIGWASPYGGAPDRPDLLRFDQVSGIHKDIKNLLDSAGIKIVPSQPQPGFTGYAGGYASVPMEQVQLIQSGKLPQKPVEPTPAPVPVIPTPAPIEPPQNSQEIATNVADPKDIAELTDILKKLGATIPSKFSINAAPNNLGPRQRNTGSNSIYEGIKFKSSIGRSLLAEAPADPDERAKLIARAKTLYDKLLPYKDNLEVSPLLAAYLTVQTPAPAPVEPEVRPVPTVRIEPHKIPDINVKPENNQEKITEYPAGWMKVPIELAPSQVGPGPNGEAVYYLGKGTPEQALGFADKRNNTLIPMVKNSQQADKRYAPIPWGDKRFPWIDSRGGVTQVQSSGSAGGSTYIVAPGDNLNKIATLLKLKLKDLQDANPQIKDFNKINPGDKINLPSSGKSTPAPTTKLSVPSETASDREIITYINQEAPNAKYHDYFWVNGRRWRLVADGKSTNRYIWREDNPLNPFGQNGERKDKKYTGPDDSPESGQEVAVTPQKEDDALRYAIQRHIKMGSPDSSPTATTVIKMADYYRKHPKELQDRMKEIGLKPMPVTEGVGYANDELSRIVSLVHHR